MARSFYPGDLMVNAGAGSPPAVVLGAGSYFTVWSLKTGGSQYVDLKAEDGVTTLPTSGSPAKPFADGNGNRPSLWGPDAVNGVLWCDTGITRYPMYPSAEVDSMLANGAKKNVANTFTAQQSFTGAATAFSNTPTVSGNLVTHAGNISAAFGAASSGQVLKWTGSAWAPAADNTGSGSGSLPPGWISVKDYGAVGDAFTDDSTAIVTARNAVLASRIGGGYLSLPVLYFPPGLYVVTQPDALFAASSVSQGTVGYTVMGAGKEVSQIYFRPVGTTASLTAMNLMTFKNTSAGGSQVRATRFRTIGFDCNNNNASFMYSYSTNTNFMQDTLFEDCMWTGTWRRVFGFDGPSSGSNLNSEMGLDHCGIHALCTDAIFNTDVTFVDGANSKDQFVNYWFRDCKVEYDSGTALSIGHGGSVSVSGGSWILYGTAAGKMFYMPYSSGHNSGTQRLHMDGVRIELRASGHQVIDCGWVSGTVKFTNCDESGSAFQASALTTIAHRYDWNAGGSGPVVTYDSCYFLGYHVVTTGSSAPQAKIRYMGCRWYQYLAGQTPAWNTTTVSTTAAATGNMRYTGSVAPHYRFEDNYGLVVAITDANN